MLTLPCLLCQDCHASHVVTAMRPMPTLPCLRGELCHASDVETALPPMPTLPCLLCGHCHASYVDTPTPPMSSLPCLLYRRCPASHANTVTPLIWSPPGLPLAQDWLASVRSLAGLGGSFRTVILRSTLAAGLVLFGSGIRHTLAGVGQQYEEVGADLVHDNMVVCALYLIASRP
ncbi:hypothetical protein EV426DRAFT_591955, partial [Tirmania nivea]